MYILGLESYVSVVVKTLMEKISTILMENISLEKTVCFFPSWGLVR